MEVIIAQELSDCGGAAHVLPFLRGLQAQLAAIHAGVPDLDASAVALSGAAAKAAAEATMMSEQGATEVKVAAASAPAVVRTRLPAACGARAMYSFDECRGDDDGWPAARWDELLAHRPSQVTQARWEQLFEFVTWKLLLLMRGTPNANGGMMHPALAWAATQLRTV